MADEVDSKDVDSTSTSGSSDASALSPEELRDVETFARHGLNPDGTPIDRKAESKAAPSKDEPDDEDDDDSDDDKTKAADDADDDEDDEAEVTDEQLDKYVDALLELNADKIANNPKLRERIEKEIRDKVEADNAAKQRAASASQERDLLARQGRAAVEAVFGQLTKAQEGFGKAQAELDKAFKGEDFDPKVLADGFKLDGKALEQNLGAFAVAAVADSRRSYDDAFSTAFKAATDVGGPVTDEERDAIISIVNTANRIEADEKQGDGRFDRAKEHLYVETWKLVTNRAYEAGKQAAIADAKAKRDARKTVLDSDAVLAGAAKEAKTRKGLPPNPTKPTGTAEVGEVSMAAYKAAKAAGNYELADEIMNEMAMNAPQEAQRRLQR